MGRVARERADLAIVTSDNPRSRGSARDHPGRPPGSRDATSRSTRTARSAIGARSALAGAGRRRRDRGQGPRAGPGDRAASCTPFDDRDVAREALRAALASARDPARLGRDRRRSASGALEAARRPTSIRRSRPTRARSRPGDLFVALEHRRRVRGRRARAGRSTLVPDDQDAALAALASLVRSSERRRRSSPSSARPARPRRRTSSARCAARASPTIWRGGEPEQRDRPAADRAAGSSRRRRCS